jgi:protein-S-isoprenylcysteine O-methyltransferase Ste14
MNIIHPAVWLCALNLTFIAALPRTFFRRGRLTASWWLTALPFVLAGAGLVAAAVARVLAFTEGAVPGLRLLAVEAGTAAAPLHILATTLAAASVALIGFTLGSHREPVSLWHQQDDEPVRLVTHGAYARIRHPFYTAFLMALGACVCAAPGALTVLAFGWAVVQLRRTALREERRLLRSRFGAAYAQYSAVTGRFLPGRTAAAAAVQSRRPVRT